MKNNFLREILVAKKKELKNIKISEPVLKKTSLINNICPGRINIIAEIKKASPSKGLIKKDLDVSEVARIYKKYSCFISGLSVLTENLYFKGKNEDIYLAKKAAGLPVLRKDFIFSRKHIYESRALGADCILLISSLFGYKKLKGLYDCARKAGLDVLVETHYRNEFIRALNMGARMIGINNRDLKSLRVDRDHIIKILKSIPSSLLAGRIIVCESGVDEISYIKKLFEMGVNVFLVGTYFMKSPDLDGLLSEFKKELAQRRLI
jgi:indole-3-glycerol phosphate synthase